MKFLRGKRHRELNYGRPLWGGFDDDGRYSRASQVLDRIYMAYGSNMNWKQMEKRCPGAVCVGTTVVPKHNIEFDRVANLVQAPLYDCPVVLWHISEAHQEKLDVYEGHPFTYRRKAFKFERKKMMTYYKQKVDRLAPTQLYVNKIIQGYIENDFEDYLDQLIAQADTAKRIHPHAKARSTAAVVHKSTPRFGGARQARSYP